VVGDVASFDDGARMVADAVGASGKLDVVICGAGIPSRARIEDLIEAEFDRVMAVNLKGMYTVIHAVVPRLKEQGGGTIVTMGSEMGFVADPNAPAYNASKGGVIMFPRSPPVTTR
jgi:NAD(P)-dependent dehydrogenase (short-subunit alcohol dehydrogenase family)